ncbi:glutamate receptor 2.7-like [Fagus crenata]
MPFPFIIVSRTASKPLFFPVLVCYFLFILLPHGGQANHKNQVIKIGAIVDVNSRIGKEELTAMKIAAQNFNKDSMSRKVSLYFLDSSRDPQQVASAAEQLIKEKKVNAIIGMHSWQEAALVADVGNRTQVPILSFAAPAIPSPMIQLRWPFLIRMANDGSAQVKCIADIVLACNWRRVIVIYEEDAYGGDSGMSALLAEALQNIGVDIDYRLLLPPFLSYSEELIHKELVKLEKSTPCRVFIVLKSSLRMVTNLFREAKKVGLVGGESEAAWIIPDSITNLLDSVDKSVISSMEGTIGIKTHYSNSTDSYKEFIDKFETSFRANYFEEENSKPGIYALRASDSISVITKAIERSTGGTLLGNMLSVNFSGLSGEIRFDGQMLSQSETPKFKIVNVDGEKCNELNYWTPDKKIKEDWPGLKLVPRGWAIAKEMTIVVPGNATFKEFVKVTKRSNNPNDDEFGGFSIEVFRKVASQLKYKFKSLNCSNDDLIELVHNKTYDAAVGAITILFHRSKLVEFIQPYTDTGLLMIVPEKHKMATAWMFTKPFTWGVWLVTAIMLNYTMFIVWFLEHQSNPKFQGSSKDKIGTAVWFAFCTLFFAERESVYSNSTRVVVVVWLFVAFVLTASYTANLSSMLTIERLEPSIEMNNATIGFNKGSFVGKYLVEILHFKPASIKEIENGEQYIKKFESNGITAAFLERPYAEVFLKKYCKGYSSSSAAYRFGGFGFAFQKGSPFARDLSEAILKLSEDGGMDVLRAKFLTPPNACSTSVTSSESETKSLGLSTFWGLCLITFSTSTICFLQSLFHLIKNYQHEATPENVISSDGSVLSKVVGLARSVWSKVVGLATYFYYKEVELSRAPSSS